MHVFRTFKGLNHFLAQEEIHASIIGFVPTMGALHSGHISLIKSSLSISDITVCSIFVNPSQFDVSDDLKNYPREVTQDLHKLRDNGCDVVFIPSVLEMYPSDYTPIKMDLGVLATQMEGRYRLGHFDGVIQVVNRFFEQIKPNFAFFGEKDYQQLAIIRAMVARLDLGINVVDCPTQRNDFGLALSSRNARLTDDGLRKAILIPTQLEWVKSVYASMDILEIKNKIRYNFNINPGFDLEYFEIVDFQNFSSIDVPHGQVRAFIAVRLEGVRLIDNVSLD